MKKTLFTIFGLICIIAITNFPAHSTEHSNPFDSLYQINGGTFDELKISAWAKIKTSTSSKKQIEEILSLLEKEYKLNLENTFEQDKNYLSVNSKGISDIKEEITVQIISTKYETYLGINLDALEMDAMARQINLLYGFYKYFNVQPTINKTAIFSVPGELKISKQEQIISKIFEEIDGTIIEGMKDERMASYSGYTPYFEGSVEVTGHKINTNIASRYHNIDDKTYIYMGTPLIHCEY